MTTNYVNTCYVLLKKWIIANWKIPVQVQIIIGSQSQSTGSQPGFPAGQVNASYHFRRFSFPSSYCDFLSSNLFNRPRRIVGQKLDDPWIYSPTPIQQPIGKQHPLLHCSLKENCFPWICFSLRTQISWRLITVEKNVCFRPYWMHGLLIGCLHFSVWWVRLPPSAIVRFGCRRHARPDSWHIRQSAVLAIA